MTRLQLVGMGVLGLISLAGIVYLTNGPGPNRNPAIRQGSETPGEIGGEFQPYRPRPEPVVARTAPPAALPLPPAGQPVVANPLRGGQTGYTPAPLMAFGTTQGNATEAPSTGALTGATGHRDSGEDGLSRRLQAEDQETAVARMLPDRNLFLTDGTPLPCIPDAPITSDVEGAFLCRVPEPVFSTSGSVPLLDAGTKIVGRVNGGLRRGQRRLFSVMTRIETPQGCIVRIRAPAADQMGQAGLDGDIDTHFFQRFGAYLGMAFLDAGMQAAVLAASGAGGNRGGVNFYQFQGAGRQGGQALFSEDAAIPPTLGRGQAQPIVVRLTQDIDMRPCFRLRLRETAR